MFIETYDLRINLSYVHGHLKNRKSKVNNQNLEVYLMITLIFDHAWSFKQYAL